MRRRLALLLLAVFTVSGSFSRALAGQTPPAGARLRRGTIEGRYFEGPIQGPWEWSKGVKVVSTDLTMTCERLKLWPTKDGRDWERIEASGSIAIQGRYVAADNTEWKVVGKAEAASYDSKTGQGVLKGSVDFQATNLSTKMVVSVAADKLTYDGKTRQFRFERGDGPVRVEWEEPQRQDEGTGSATQPPSGGSGKEQ